MIGAEGRQLALAAALQLVGEQAEEAGRPAGEVQHAVRNAVRLGADREGDRAVRGRDEHQRVGAGAAAERAQLVAGDQHLPAAQAAPAEPVEHVRGGMRLVCQADLQVLGVGGDAGVGQAGLAAAGERKLDRLRQAAVDPGLGETRLDRCEQPGQLGLRGLRPLGKRDQVDLAPVQPVGDEPGLEAPFCEPGSQQRRRGGHLLLLERQSRCGGNRRFGPFGPSSNTSEPRLTADQHPARPVGTQAELVVDVGELGAGDHRQVEAGAEQGGEQVAGLAGVRGAIGDGGAVPVEHARFEPGVERFRPGHAHEAVRATGESPLPPGQKTWGRSRSHLTHSHRRPGAGLESPRWVVSPRHSAWSVPQKKVKSPFLSLRGRTRFTFPRESMRAGPDAHQQFPRGGLGLFAGQRSGEKP